MNNITFTRLPLSPQMVRSTVCFSGEGRGILLMPATTAVIAPLTMPTSPVNGDLYRVMATSSFSKQRQFFTLKQIKAARILWAHERDVVLQNVIISNEAYLKAMRVSSFSVEEEAPLVELIVVPPSCDRVVLTQRLYSGGGGDFFNELSLRENLPINDMAETSVERELSSNALTDTPQCLLVGCSYHKITLLVPETIEQGENGNWEQLNDAFAKQRKIAFKEKEVLDQIYNAGSRSLTGAEETARFYAGDNGEITKPLVIPEGLSIRNITKQGDSLVLLFDVEAFIPTIFDYGNKGAYWSILYHGGLEARLSVNLKTFNKEFYMGYRNPTNGRPRPNMPHPHVSGTHMSRCCMGSYEALMHESLRKLDIQELLVNMSMFINDININDTFSGRRLLSSSAGPESTWALVGLLSYHKFVDTNYEETSEQILAALPPVLKEQMETYQNIIRQAKAPSWVLEMTQLPSHMHTRKVDLTSLPPFMRDKHVLRMSASPAMGHRGCGQLELPSLNGDDRKKISLVDINTDFLTLVSND